jgi:hypothetical protein
MGAHQSPVVPASANSGVLEYLLSDVSAGVNGQMINIEGPRMTLYVHPGRQYPVLERAEGWPAEAVAEAFKNELADRQLPAGTAMLKVDVVK